MKIRFKALGEHIIKLQKLQRKIAAKDSTRPKLQYTQLEIKDSKCTAIVLDGYRAHQYTFDVDCDSEWSGHVNFTNLYKYPAKTKDGYYIVEIDEEYMSIEFGGFKTASKILKNGELFDFNEITNNNTNFRIALNRQYLKDMLDAIDSKALVFEFDTDVSPVFIKPMRKVLAEETAVILPLRIEW